MSPRTTPTGSLFSSPGLVQLLILAGVVASAALALCGLAFIVGFFGHAVFDALMKWWEVGNT